MKNGEVQYISHVRNGKEPRPGYAIGPQVEGCHHNEFSRLSETPPMSGAADICTRAANLVAGDRDRTHGSKAQNFMNIARLWNAYLANRKDRASDLAATEVADLMELLKVARRQGGAFNLDDYIDGAGYAGCAGELAEMGL